MSYKSNAQINAISKDVFDLEKHHVANKKEAHEYGDLNDMALAAYYKNGGTTKLPLLTPAQTESYFQELEELKKMVEQPQQMKDTPDREYE